VVQSMRLAEHERFRSVRNNVAHQLVPFQNSFSPPFVKRKNQSVLSCYISVESLFCAVKSSRWDKASPDIRDGFTPGTPCRE
jgi:hypothetical protein